MNAERLHFFSGIKNKYYSINRSHKYLHLSKNANIVSGPMISTMFIVQNIIPNGYRPTEKLLYRYTGIYCQQNMWLHDATRALKECRSPTRPLITPILPGFVIWGVSIMIQIIPYVIDLTLGSVPTAQVAIAVDWPETVSNAKFVSHFYT